MQFSKMHGINNDFMVVDGVTQNVYFSADLIRRLADRRYGIGFEQLLVVEPPYDPELDFHYRLFNADGNESKQYANGATCLASFLRQKGLTNKRKIKVGSSNGAITLNINAGEQVTVNLGEPVFEPQRIPFRAAKIEKTYILRTAERTILCGVVAIVGEAHCIIQVDNIDDAEVNLLGGLLQNHERFPEATNVGFLQVINSHKIKLRGFISQFSQEQLSDDHVCAAVATGIFQGTLETHVEVDLPTGNITVSWQGPGNPLIMTSSATHVYDGFIHL